MTSQYTTKTYVDMLTYKRPEGSDTQAEFCKKYLEPVFGKPDPKGNYILSVGKDVEIAFMSHHDTVHSSGGRQIVDSSTEFVKATGKDCLGADCTTGIYIMLKMIEAGVSGLYIVHAAEEIGCKGSAYIVDTRPDLVAGMKAAISFDRYGYGSVITHQMGYRTCSDEFAESLADTLGLGMQCDKNGSYTDSNEYTGLIPECTNVSVGYFSQHTATEQQDVLFMDVLADACIAADWSKLVIKRTPQSVEDLYEDLDWPIAGEEARDPDLLELVYAYPDAIANLLYDWGYTANGLLDDLDSKPWKKYSYYDI